MMFPGPMVGETFERIDAIRSTSTMQAELAALSPDVRADVLRHALTYSRFQFHWSHFANVFELPHPWPQKL